MRWNGINTFILHVAQCIIFNQTNRVKTTLIANVLLKSFYSRLGLKVIKDFANSPNFEEAHKRIHYESGKSKAYQKKTIGLQCLQTTPRRVTFLHDNQINLNILKMCSEIYTMFQHQKIGSQINILRLRSRINYTKPEENLQVIKCKTRLDITLNLSITVSNG